MPLWQELKKYMAKNLRGAFNTQARLLSDIRQAELDYLELH